jgi:urease accessory protein
MLYVVTWRSPVGVLADRLYDCLATRQEVLSGISELPNGCGVAVRFLGDDSATVTATMRLAWNEARLTLVGLPAPDLRKG